MHHNVGEIQSGIQTITSQPNCVTGEYQPPWKRWGRWKWTWLTFENRILAVDCQTGQKNCAQNHSVVTPFVSTECGLAILKLSTCIYVIDNESQVSHSQRRKFQIKKRGKTRISWEIIGFELEPEQWPTEPAGLLRYVAGGLKVPDESHC